MGCGASAKKNKEQEDKQDGTGEKGGAKGAKEEKEKKEVDIEQKLDKIEFEKLDLGAVDDTFDKAAGIFNSILDTNMKLVEGVQKVITSKSSSDEDKAKSSSAVLAQRIQDALLGARDAMEDAMPDNVGDIRKKALEAKDTAEKAACAKDEERKKLQDEATKQATEVAKLITAALPKMKTLLPKVEGTTISFPEGIKLEKLGDGAKKAMQMVIDFFEMLKQVGSEAVNDLKVRIEEIMKDIKALPAKLKDCAKEKMEKLGAMEKVKYLKEKGDLLAKNSKLAGKLKEYMEVLAKKLAAIGTILKDAFSQALEVALKYAPGVVAALESAAASVKDSVTKIADANKDEIDAAKAKVAEGAGKAKEEAASKGAPSAAPAAPAAEPAAPAAAAAPAAEPEKKDEQPAAPAAAAEPAAAEPAAAEPAAAEPAAAEPAAAEPAAAAEAKPAEPAA